MWVSRGLLGWMAHALLASLALAGLAACVATGGGFRFSLLENADLTLRTNGGADPVQEERRETER